MSFASSSTTNSRSSFYPPRNRFLGAGHGKPGFLQACRQHSVDHSHPSYLLYGSTLSLVTGQEINPMEKALIPTGLKPVHYCQLQLILLWCL